MTLGVIWMSVRLCRFCWMISASVANGIRWVNFFNVIVLLLETSEATVFFRDIIVVIVFLGLFVL